MDLLLSPLLAHWPEYCADLGVWRLKYLTLHYRRVVLMLETVINTLNSTLAVGVDSSSIKLSIEALYRKQKWTSSFGTKSPRIYLQRSSFKDIVSLVLVFEF